MKPKNFVESPIVPDMAAGDLVADSLEGLAPVVGGTSCALASSFSGRRRRAARPTDGTSKLLTADDILAEYQRLYRKANPDKALRWRVSAARNLLLRMGARIIWPDGDPTAPDAVARISSTTSTDAPGDMVPGRGEV